MSTTMLRHFLPPPPFSPPNLRRRIAAATSSTACPVPTDQQPINEYKSLSTSFPFSLCNLNPVQYSSRLFATGAGFSALIGFPVAWVGSRGEVVEAAVAAGASGVVVVTLLVVRMYLGWAYVGNRLLSATVEYEETGWYDGQVWVKTAEILARDRLLGSFSVKPVLTRLKNSLVILAASLCACALVLIDFKSNQTNVYKFLNEDGGRAVSGVYSEESARSFEPDAFCGKPDIE